MSNLSSLEIFEKQTAIAFVHNAWARRKGNTVRTEFVWDPTEPVATRPLIMRAKNWGLNLFYTHDGNKNVSEVFYHAPQNGIAAHYDYAPFGAVTRTFSATRVTNRDLLSENPFRFSSEYHDDTMGLVYYNYRHYDPANSRWCGRDIVFQLNSYVYQGNLSHYDMLGLAGCCIICVYSAISIDTAMNNLTGPLQNPGEFGEHTWFTIGNDMDEESTSRAPTEEDLTIFSFGPEAPASTKELFWGTPGGSWPVDGYSDRRQYVMAKRCWSADRETCCNLKQDVNEFNENPEEFSAFNYCTSKTVDLLRRHNIDVPDGEGEIEIPYFFNIFAPNPRDMYNQLNSLPNTLQQQYGTNKTPGKKIQ